TLYRRPPSCITAPSPPDTYTLSLHDALPISRHRSIRKRRREPAEDRGGGARLHLLGRHRHGIVVGPALVPRRRRAAAQGSGADRSEEHTSELQSRENLVCRLLLEKKKHKATR